MDYQAIADQLTDERVIKIMTRLGADRYEDKGTHLIFPTVCHNEYADEASMKLYFYKDKKIFVCYTECGTMSIFKLLKNYYETRGIDYDWYRDIYQVVVQDFGETEGFQRARYQSLHDKFDVSAAAPLKVYNSCVLDCFERYYTYEWLNDGISKEAMNKFNIKYSIVQNKIIIPHLSVNGELVGIRGRALNQDDIETFGKYMPIQMEQTWYSHPLSLNLYGLYENKENISRAKRCYLFESEKSVLQMESFNQPNCAVAVCGSQFNINQLRLLMKYCAPTEIVVCFDNEELPREHKYFDKLYSLCKKYTNYANFSFIYDRYGLSKLKDSPSDNGEKIFNELLAKRVKVI